MDVDSEDRRARNLTGISFAALVYILSGAHFTHESFIFGGGVRLHNPGVLEQAGVAIYLYAFYHFLRAHRRKCIQEMANIIRKAMHSDPLLRSHIEKRFQCELKRRLSRPSNKPSTENLDWVVGQQQSGQAMMSSFPDAHLPPRTEGDPPPSAPISFSRLQTKARVGAVNERKRDGIGGMTVPINPAPVVFATVRAAIITVLRHDHFWEKLFPIVFALAVGELILLEWWFSPR